MRLTLKKIKKKGLFILLLLFSVALDAANGLPPTGPELGGPGNNGLPTGPGLGGPGNGLPTGPGLGGAPGKKTPIDSYEMILIVVALSFVVGYYLYRRRQLSLEK